MSDQSDRDEPETARAKDDEPAAQAPEAPGAPESAKAPEGAAGASEAAEGTEAGPRAPERQAKDELFEAIDHFKNAASILFERASKDPAVRSATSEAERLAKKLGDAAEPLARQLTDEVGRLTRDVWSVVEGKGKRPAPPPPPPKEDDEE